MPDPNPLNDPELERLERRLSRVSWSPAPREHERLLFACGQAAGQAQMMRRVRGATAVAALMGCACVGLVAALVLHEKSPPVAGINPAPRTALQSAALLRDQESPREAGVEVVDRNRQLTVAASFGEVLLAELPQKIVPRRESSPRLAAEPILTTAGPLPVDL